jgi:hypothetical protein
MSLRSQLHRLSSRLSRSFATHSHQIYALGWVGWLLLQAHLRSSVLSRWFGQRLWPKDSLFTLRFRPGTSDLTVFMGIFLEQEYACFKTVRPGGLIIDCGANVGYSTAYFLSRFKSAHIVAVEPDPDNFALLCANTRRFGRRVQRYNTAVWSHPCGLVINETPYRDGREWARQARPTRPG